MTTSVSHQTPGLTGMSDDMQRTARAFGDNMAALFANSERPMLLSTLGAISDAVGVPISDLLSPSFDAGNVPGRPALALV